MAVKVIVSGSGEIKRQPELGHVSIQVRSTGQDQARVSSEVRNTVKMVQDQLEPLASSSSDHDPNTAAVKEWSSGLLSTYSYFEHPGSNYHSVQPKSARTRIYEASVNVSATFADFTRLADFSTAMSLVPHAEVNAVSWVLTQETKQRLNSEVISLAYKDAWAKADAYATALGKTGVTPVEISQGDDTMYDFGGAAPMMARAAGAPDGDGGERLSCVPQDVSFSVTCKVTFQVE